MGKIIFKNTRDKYGDSYKNHLMNQYELYLNSAESISSRRESANKYFLGINSVFIVAGSFLIERVSVKNDLIILLFGILLMGLSVCVIFFYLINSYKQLNTAKFKLLHSIEEELPLNLYSKEWEILGKGEDKKKYFPFSHIERIIPFLFGLAYLGGIIFLAIKII
jgi:hypothetical protein